MLVSYPARSRSARARRACALRALGLLLADSAPTVGRKKTFWRVCEAVCLQYWLDRGTPKQPIIWRPRRSCTLNLPNTLYFISLFMLTTRTWWIHYFAYLTYFFICYIAWIYHFMFLHSFIKYFIKWLLIFIWCLTSWLWCSVIQNIDTQALPGVSVRLLLKLYTTGFRLPSKLLTAWCQ